MDRITERDWKVWAHLSRQEWGSKLGYPSRTPWSRPELTGYPDHAEDEEIGWVDDAEVERAEAIGKAVAALYRQDWRLGWAVYVRWRARAYIASEAEEAHRSRWTVDQLHDYGEAGQRWCEAWLG